MSMLMNTLRSGTFVKWVMWIVVATFVEPFFLSGMDVNGKQFEKTTVGQIGNKKIQYQIFNEELNTRIKNMKTKGDEEDLL